MRRLLIAILWGSALALSGGPAPAESFTAAGLEFSDEMGGFHLISVTGSGSLSDPIVVVEKITQVNPVVLVIRGEQVVTTGDGPPRKSEFLNLALIKVAINSTNQVWNAFDLELEEQLGKPSPYEDGLSFDQLGSFVDEPFVSDSFSQTRRIPEPYDRVQFFDGSVDPGAAARFNLYITDPTPVLEWYLVQEPHLIIADTLSPALRIADARGRAAR